MKQFHLHYLATPAGAAEFLREADRFENRLGVEIVEALRREIQDQGEAWSDTERSNTVDAILRENGVFDVYDALQRCVEVIGHNACSTGTHPNGFVIALEHGRQALAKADRRNDDA